MCMLQKPNILICTFLTGILYLLIMPCTVTASAEAWDKAEELPNQMLFQIENMKPGDWTTEKFTVSNKSQENTPYLSASAVSGGSKKVYNQLQFTDKHGNDTLSPGQLADLQGFGVKTLDTGEKAQFEFRIAFP